MSAPGWDDYLRLDHVLDLVDDVGIIQHANGAVPARDTGYCVDDVARQVVVGAQSFARDPDPASRRLVLLGLAFLEDALGREEGDAPAAEPVPPGGRRGMHNFMAYDRTWLDEPHLGDMVGRTVWALGDVVRYLPAQPALVRPAHRLLHRLLPLVARFDSTHEWAYAVLGLASTSDCDECRPSLVACTDALVAAWDANARDDWPWLEPVLTYDNPRFPQAFLVAGQALGRDDVLRRGERSLDFFVDLTRGEDGQVSTVGNHWLHRGQELSDYSGDEQPIDVGSLVECLVDAARILHRPALLDDATRAFSWFLGANRLSLALFDPLTFGCHDGLGETAVNENQGAESTLAFTQAALALARSGREAPRGDDVRAQSGGRRGE